MTTKKKWAARAAVLGMTATVLVGVGTTAADANGSTCTKPGQRPNGPVTNALAPLFGEPGETQGRPLGDTPFAVTQVLDLVVCQLLP